VNVLVGSRKSKFAVLDLSFDGLQTADDLSRIAGADYLLLSEHLGMRDTPHNIVAVKRASMAIEAVKLSTESRYWPQGVRPRVWVSWL
jgi:hypothetical protein